VNDTNSPNPEPGEVPAASGPSREQRLARAREYQAQALQRPDPLAANFGVITSDLMVCAHLLAPIAQADLGRPAGPAQEPRDYRSTELYLRVVRQVERQGRVERQLAAPPSEARGGR
jgi:hypothetical protein